MRKVMTFFPSDVIPLTWTPEAEAIYLTLPVPPAATLTSPEATCTGRSSPRPRKLPSSANVLAVSCVRALPLAFEHRLPAATRLTLLRQPHLQESAGSACARA